MSQVTFQTYSMLMLSQLPNRGVCTSPLVKVHANQKKNPDYGNFSVPVPIN